MAGLPKQYLHAHSGRSRVRLTCAITKRTQDFYLGPWGAPETQRAYDRVVGEWLANSRTLPQSVKALTIRELVDAFAVGRSIKWPAFKILLSRYGDTPAASFSSSSMKAVRFGLVQSGLVRGTVAAYCKWIRQAFRWAVCEELLPPTVLTSIASLPPLTTGVKDKPPVCAVPQAHIDQLLPHLSKTLKAMVGVHLLTGMRPTELCMMRPMDLDTSGSIWLYVPRTHKTHHRGKQRIIAVGPKAQAIIKPLLPSDIQREIFLTRSGRRWTHFTYRQEIVRAADRHGLPRFHPNQLRHAAATNIRKALGLDAAQAVLGHSTITVTQVYAERMSHLSIEAAQQLG